MKSIPLALTWEFWRQVWSPLLSTVMILVGLMALLYNGLRPHNDDFEKICFVFVVVGAVAVVCGATSSPQYRFTLPVSIRASVLIPTINGAVAVGISYLAVALLVNGLFDARWTLFKPTVLAICIFTMCQAVAWMIWTSTNLRASIVAGVCPALSIGGILLNTNSDWHKFQPLDVSLAIYIPIAAHLFSLGVLTLARRGCLLTLNAMGRWLLAKLDFRFRSHSHRMTPKAATLWAEWTTRGQVLPYGILAGAAVLCVICLLRRIEWQLARDAMFALTWLQVIVAGPILGLFLGHVGPRFDFHEHLATRPLSDTQLADVKLWNTLKSVCWIWVAWSIGLAMAIACLTLVGQGPKNWDDVVPVKTPRLVPTIVVVMIPLCSWTVTSLGVSVVILRPRMVKIVLVTAALLPFIPLTLSYFIPRWSNEIIAASQWWWNCVIIGGTIAIYAAAFRLRLITVMRMVIAGLAYVLLCAAGLLAARLLPRPEMPLALSLAFLASSAMLPLVSLAAAPLAVWWNRHR